MATITQETLKDLFDYKDGTLFYKEDGRAATNDLHGRPQVATVGNNTYRLHRLVWIWHNGPTTFPIMLKDNNPLNVSIENLKEIDENVLIVRGKPKTNKRAGVYYKHSDGGWVARINGQKSQERIGVYPTEHEAHAAWLREWQLGSTVHQNAEASAVNQG